MIKRSVIKWMWCNDKVVHEEVRVKWSYGMKWKGSEASEVMTTKIADHAHSLAILKPVTTKFPDQQVVQSQLSAVDLLHSKSSQVFLSSSMILLRTS